MKASLRQALHRLENTRKEAPKPTTPHLVEVPADDQQTKLKHRYWELHNFYHDENSTTLLRRKAVSTAQRQREGWQCVRTVKILEPYPELLDVLWLPATEEREEQIVACYGFFR